MHKNTTSPLSAAVVGIVYRAKSSYNRAPSRLIRGGLGYEPLMAVAARIGRFCASAGLSGSRSHQMDVEAASCVRVPPSIRRLNVVARLSGPILGEMGSALRKCLREVVVRQADGD